MSDAAGKTGAPLDQVASRKLGRPGPGVSLPDGIAARLARTDGTIAVMIELTQAPALVAYGQAQQSTSGTAGTGAAAARAGRSQLTAVEVAQQSLLSALSRTSARVLYRAQRVYNGIAVRVQMRDIPQLRRLPGVKAVHALVPKQMSNWNSVPFVGAVSAWTQGVGYTGEGIRVGVIDTGIDYLHSNFGGPGASADYAGNDTTIVGDAPNYPGAKVVGGHDFVGDAYDGGAPAGDPALIPHPDEDPMDCNGHGSHVAGTIGGYGVNGDGTPYTGTYDGSTNFDAFRIGPGVAPKVSLYALRVFGCEGSTNVVTEALDWAVDPNGDGDFSDHLDVVNMSLGSNFGGPDDPDAVASDNASLAGTIVAAASGNAGDTYYITSSPAAAGRAISVAASLDKAAVVSGFLVNPPSSIAGSKPASEAVFGRDVAVGDVTGDLALSSPSNGCTPPITGVTGKMALIDRGTCSFKTKVHNAQLAGALGVVITNNAPGFPITMGDDPAVPDNPTISAMMTDKTNGDAIRAAMGSETVNVTLTAAQRERVKSVQPAVEDTIASFSSRGVSRLGGALKPDIDSVGETVFSTQALSGTEGDSFNGTSMATPHIAGTMALLRQIHPTWTVEELKALVMNTANHNIFLNLGPALPNTGPGRVGAGREDIASAVTSDVVAYSADGSGRVSVSFGPLEITGATTLSKTVKVTNRGTSSATFAVAFNGTNMPDIQGVTIGTSTASVSVGPGATETFNVILTADPTLMKHSRDASVANAQANGFGNLFRNFLSEKAGYVTLTPGSGPVLRVPVHAAARPASTMTTTETSLDIRLGANTGSKTLTLSGTGVNTGASFSTTSPFPGQDEVSLVSAFELQEASEELTPGPGSEDSADLQYVGVAKSSDAFGSIINFGIAAYGNWSTANPTDTEFDVYIDADRDGNPDFVLFNWNAGSASGAGAQDNLFSALVDLSTNDLFLERRINGISPSTRDTVTFNNRMMGLSVYAEDMGITGSFDYFVASFTREAGLVDVSDLHTWNLSAPGLSAPGAAPYAAAGAPMYNDLPGTISVAYDRNAYNAAGSKGLLLLHHHNATGTQAQVITVASVPRKNGDFSGDNKADILWHHDLTGTVVVWSMDGTNRTGVTIPGAADISWKIVGTGDFNGDDKIDILWYHAPTGTLAVWFMDGTAMTGVAVFASMPDLNWQIVGTGDFNGDNKPDILWRSVSDGTVAIWLMDGTTVTGVAVPGSATLNWKIVGTGDFNGDGKTDILWRDEVGTGTIAVWFMDGTTMTGVAVPAAVPALNWKIVGTGDFNGDGKPDILWRDEATTGPITGTIAVWFMDGTTLTGATITNPSGVPNLHWRIVGPK